MKVLCILTSGIGNCGITNNLLTYYEHMKDKDIQIDMLKINKDSLDIIREKIDRSGVNIIESAVPRKKVIEYIWYLKKLIKVKRYDIVHVHGSSSIMVIELFAALLGGCKVRIAHSRNTTCKYHIIDKVLRPFFHLMCTERFACGEEAGRWLFGKRKFTIVRNAKNIKLFAYDESVRNDIRDKYGWGDKLIVGHVGWFNYQKNHEYMVKICQAIDKKNLDYKMVFVGNGEYEDDIKNIMNEKGLSNRVEFMGGISNVHEILQGMDVMILPSRYEGLPNVVLEWQISGLPSIISDKVTKECKLTDFVTYLPITDEAVEMWVENIVELSERSKRDIQAKEGTEQIIAAGFEIEKAAEILYKKYESLVNL